MKVYLPRRTPAHPTILLRSAGLFRLPCLLTSLSLGLSIGLALPLSVTAQSTLSPPVSGKTTSTQAPPPPAAQKAFALFTKAMALQKEKKYREALAAYDGYLKEADAVKLPPALLLPACKNKLSIYQYLLQRDGAQGAKSPAYLQDLRGTEMTLQRMALLTPKDAAPLVELATLYSTQKRFDEAKTAANRAIALKPGAALAAPAHFVLGAVAYANHDLPTAETEYGAAAKLTPNNGQAQFDYALVLGEEKKFKPALDAALAARKAAPNLLPARLYIATLRQQMHDQPGALAAYQDVVRLDRRNLAALFNIALLDQQMARVGDAITAYNALLKIDPTNLSANLNVGQLYYTLGNSTAAKEHFAQAVRTAPKDPRALAGLALSETDEGYRVADKAQRTKDLQQAEAHFKAAIALEPKNIAYQNQLGVLYERGGRLTEALAIYRKRQTADPDNYESYYRIAKVYKMQRQASNVVTTWKAYQSRKPADPMSYSEIAQSYEEEGKWQEAIDTRVQLAVRDPKDGGSRLLMATDWQQLKQPAKARADFEQVLTLDVAAKDVPQAKRMFAASSRQSWRLAAWRGLAQVAEGEGKIEEVLAYLTNVKTEEVRLAKRDEKAPDAHIYHEIAAVYERAKKPDLAIKELTALTDDVPQDTSAYIDLARLNEAQGKTDAAVAALRKGVPNTKDSLDLSLRIADLYRRANRIEDAVDVYINLLPNYSKEPRLLTPMAQALEQSGNNAKALEVYNTLLQGDPKLRWAEDKKATVLVRLKRFPEARAIREKAVLRNPDDLQSYADLAQTYEAEGKSAAYLVWLQLRVEKNLARRTQLNALLDAYQRQQKAAEGWTYLKALMEKHKNERQAQEAYADVLTSHNRGNEAIEVRRQIAERYPNDLQAQFSLIDSLDLASRKEEASRLYETLIARPGNTPETIIGLRRQNAQRLETQGSIPEAILQYRAITKIAPKDVDSQLAQARLLRVAGRDAEAIPLYENLMLDPTFAAPVIRARTLVLIADIYEKIGKKPDAAARYRDALKLDATNLDASVGLKRVAP